jgi:hypothetical protein
MCHAPEETESVSSLQVLIVQWPVRRDLSMFERPFPHTIRFSHPQLIFHLFPDKFSVCRSER